MPPLAGACAMPPPRLVYHHAASAHLHTQTGGSGSAVAGATWLDALSQKRRIDQIRACVLLLESIVPWDLSVGAILRGVERDTADDTVPRAADALTALTRARDRQTADDLLRLFRRDGEVEISRAAKLFAFCDEDHDAMLGVDELFAAATAIRTELARDEARAPPSPLCDDLSDIHTVSLDPALPTALRHFEQVCFERLHDLSILRLLVPPPATRTGAKTWKAGLPGVGAIAAAASALVKGGEAARIEAARQAIDDALLEEHIRVRKLIERRGEGVRLLPFLVAVLDLRSDLACAKAGVMDLVQAHDARVEAAQAARRAAQAAQEQARADVELAERKRREMHTRHTLGEVDHLQQLVMSASGQDLARPPVAAPAAETSGALRHVEAAPAVWSPPNATRGVSSPGAESSTSSFFSNVHLHSDWQPGVRLAYLEERERRKHVSVGSLMSGMPMES